MKATFKKPYFRKGGKTIGFMYTVSGTPQELEAYKEAQAENYREEDGKPLYFARSGGYEGKSQELEITDSGVFPKTSRLEILKKLIASTTDALDKEILTDEYRALKSAHTKEALNAIEALNNAPVESEGPSVDEL